jgi:hypothetical protein
MNEVRGQLYNTMLTYSSVLIGCWGGGLPSRFRALFLLAAGEEGYLADSELCSYWLLGRRVT